ncbi:hypothetical protein DKT77_10660 [Meridianimarinicoccus roseus]|uniref:VPLPA-CTERM sorting domain-containing protein n=1 Tax=Meridianimarinicoccus roseus TaxID=2072018 RepID=A0A2V2LGK5_9RHOB|nr:VPLPA-CTERM sorting domain-containing protein [Meridianimarinicoccus roseus]PWR02634.1 hypothetical protein DKT77_10660 [Meridianimarinicoccus roseus]
MKSLISALAFGFAALGAADHAEAAPLNVATDTPLIDIPFASADFLDLGGFGDLSILGAEGLASGTPQSGTLSLDVLISFDTTDPAGTIGGALFSMDDNGAFLDGTLVQSGFDGDILQLLFGNLTGSAAADFGPFALLEAVFLFPALGTDPLSQLTDATTYDVFGTLSSATPVPLPAALPLLAAGLGGLVLLRRRS